MCTCCYCGRDFGPSSLTIHWKSCLKKRKIAQRKLPKASRTRPPEPPSLPVPTRKSTAAEFRAYNAMAMEIYRGEMPKCPYCHRTFSDIERLNVHLKSCGPEKAAELAAQAAAQAAEREAKAAERKTKAAVRACGLLTGRRGSRTLTPCQQEAAAKRKADAAARKEAIEAGRRAKREAKAAKKREQEEAAAAATAAAAEADAAAAGDDANQDGASGDGSAADADADAGAGGDLDEAAMAKAAAEEAELARKKREAGAERARQAREKARLKKEQAAAVCSATPIAAFTACGSGLTKCSRCGAWETHAQQAAQRAEEAARRKAADKARKAVRHTNTTPARPCTT